MDARGGTIKKQLILISPFGGNLLFGLGLTIISGPQPTTALLILAALTPEDYTITISNLRFFWGPDDFCGGALVGISCCTGNAPRGYALADRYRKAGSRVVMGGPHISQVPEEALAHCDAVVIGEAESVWADVIRDYESATLKRVYRGEPLEDCFSPSFEYFLKRAESWALLRTGVAFSRGCKYRCDFCARPCSGLRFMKLDQAVRLVEKMRRGNRFPLFRDLPLVFHDNNLFSDPGYARELFRRIAPLGVRWIGNCSVDVAFDEEALRLARASGCRGLLIGFETIYPRKLQKTSVHHMASSGDYCAAIRRIQSHGIRVTGSFILGFDYYTHKDYFRLVWFLIRSGLFSVSMSILTPFPGTALYERLRQEGRLTTFDWSKYDLLRNVVYRPLHMSALALQMWFLVLRTISLLITPNFWLLAFRNSVILLFGYGVVLYLVSFFTSGLF